MGTRERKAREFDRREREILDRALELLEREDWRVVTIDRIAEAAEIGKGTIYKHFESKDEIVAQLAIDLRDDTLRRLSGVDPRQSVAARLRDTVRVLWDAEGSASLVERRLLELCEREDLIASLSNATRIRYQAQLAELDGTLEQIVEAGITQRLFPRKPLELMVFYIRSTLLGAVRAAWSTPLAPDQRDEYADELANFILAGLMYQGRVTDSQNMD